MRYNKQPISISDQIDVLKRRGLIFNDEQNAQNILENISYFRLAGYWRTMEQDSSRHISTLHDGLPPRMGERDVVAIDTIFCKSGEDGNESSSPDLVGKTASK